MNHPGLGNVVCIHSYREAQYQECTKYQEYQQVVALYGFMVHVCTGHSTMYYHPWHSVGLPWWAYLVIGRTVPHV